MYFSPLKEREYMIEASTLIEDKVSNTKRVEYLIYFFFSVLDILLVFRLVLKLMGASTASGFVRFIYGMSRIFVLPFEGIFGKWFTPGLETTSVLEPSTIVALIVYAVIAWGIVKLIQVLSREPQAS